MTARQHPTPQRAMVESCPVIVLRDTSCPVVKFMIAYRGGAVRDPQGSSGLTAMRLDALLRGTQTKSRDQFAKALERMGSRLNVHVENDVASLHGSCLTRFLEPTLDLLRDALLAPSFDPEQLRKLRDETIEDLRSARDDDSDLVNHFFYRHMYSDAWFSRSPSGSMAELRGLERDALVRAHTQSLSQHDFIWVFSGDIHASQAQQAVASITPYLTAPAPEPLPTPTASQHSLEIVVVDKPDRTQAQIRVGVLVPPWNQLGNQAGKQAAWPLWLGVLAFGGTFTSPLTHAVREVRGWSYVAHATLARRQRHLHPMVLTTAPALDDAVDCLALQMAMLQDLKAGQLDAIAIEQAKSYALNRLPFETARAEDMMIPSVQLELLNESLDQLFRSGQAIEQTTADEIAMALKTHLSDAPMVATLVGMADRLAPVLTQRFPDAHITVKDYREGLEDIRAADR